MKPILFNTEMVRAIQNGTKTVTRRVVKPHSPKACDFYVTYRKSDGAFMGVYDYDEHERMFDSPQAQPAYPGDILYVRETWRVRNVYGDFAREGRTAEIEFRAGGDFSYMRIYEDSVYSCAWQPSIHMPRKAARIFLRVTDVRVERLQESFFRYGNTIFYLQREGIDVGEQCRECIDTYGSPICNDRESKCGVLDEVRSKFSNLWDSTIKPIDHALYGWSANPWVWVVEFEQISREEAKRG